MSIAMAAAPHDVCLPWEGRCAIDPNNVCPHADPEPRTPLDGGAAHE